MFADRNITGADPSGIFLTIHNRIYLAGKGADRMQIWSNNNHIPTQTIFGNLSYPQSIFVTFVGDIFVDNGFNYSRVDKFAHDTNTSIPVMYVNSTCHGLFVDITNTLYCSAFQNHQVIKRWLDDHSNLSTIVAGNGTAGNTLSMLNEPYGIFLNKYLDLYVADARNDRIQLFVLGQRNGTTVAGNGSINITITLSYPTTIVLDAENYLFIVDNYNKRIVGSGPNGFRCIVGCDGGGTGSNQLTNLCSLSFDSYGNLFVTDSDNDTILKFSFTTSSCGKFQLHSSNFSSM